MPSRPPADLHRCPLQSVPWSTRVPHPPYRDRSGPPSTAKYRHLLFYLKFGVLFYNSTNVLCCNNIVFGNKTVVSGTALTNTIIEVKVLCDIGGIHIALLSKEGKYQHSSVLRIWILKSQLLLNIWGFLRGQALTAIPQIWIKVLWNCLAWCHIWSVQAEVTDEQSHYVTMVGASTRWVYTFHLYAMIPRVISDHARMRT